MAIEILAQSAEPESGQVNPIKTRDKLNHINEKLHPSIMVTSIYSKGSNPLNYNQNEKDNRYKTIHKDEFSPKDRLISKRYNRKFNKRKSPYQMYSEAKFNHGVYFNPPLNGL